MARTVATLPEGSRITDYISLGVVAKTFPLSKIRSVFAATGKPSVRERDPPTHVLVYYVIALSLFIQSSFREVLRCLLEGVQWLLDPSVPIKVAGKSRIPQARSRRGDQSPVGRSPVRLRRRAGDLSRGPASPDGLRLGSPRQPIASWLPYSRRRGADAR